MSVKNDKYAHIETLEIKIKIAFSMYALIFISGIGLITVGPTHIFLMFQTLHLGYKIAISGVIVCLAIVFYFLIGKISWLGKLHVWIDDKFFGFLKNSNELIFRVLTFSLDSEEKKQVHALDLCSKDALAKSILSRLAEDYKLFETLMQSGIFRNWIRYWISIYGTGVFLILTTICFVVIFIRENQYYLHIFFVSWALAFLNICLVLLIGSLLLKISQRAVKSIVSMHSKEISSMFREKLAEKVAITVDQNDQSDLYYEDDE